MNEWKPDESYFSIFQTHAVAGGPASSRDRSQVRPPFCQNDLQLTVCCRFGRLRFSLDPIAKGGRCDQIRAYRAH